MTTGTDVERLLDLYEQNRSSLGRALLHAGGNSEAIMMSSAWREVLRVCTQNWIVLDAEYTPKYSAPEKHTET